MNTELIIAYTGLALGILGLITGYVFYRKGLRLKKPGYSIESNNLIEDNNVRIEGLEITYKKERIRNLTVSKVLFWNLGRDTIDRNDIETVNHVRIVPLNGIKILDASIISSSSPSNRFTAKLLETENCVLLDFDYLNFRQGAVIQVIHTGKLGDIHMVGEIKGVDKILDSYTPGRFRMIFLGMVIYFLGSIMINMIKAPYVVFKGIEINIQPLISIISLIPLGLGLFIAIRSMAKNDSMVSFINKNIPRDKKFDLPVDRRG